MSDYAISTRNMSGNIKKNRQMLEANEVKVLSKIVGKTKIDRISENPAVSYLLMREWKEE